MARSHRTLVTSALLASVGYDAKTKALTAEFTPKAGATEGDLYTYVGVPSKVFVDLMSAESHGKFFLKNIRNNPKYITALVSASR